MNDLNSLPKLLVDFNSVGAGGWVSSVSDEEVWLGDRVLAHCCCYRCEGKVIAVEHRYSAIDPTREIRVVKIKLASYSGWDSEQDESLGVEIP